MKSMFKHGTKIMFLILSERKKKKKKNTLNYAATGKSLRNILVQNDD